MSLKYIIKQNVEVLPNSWGYSNSTPSESLTLPVVPQMFALQWKTQDQWWTETLMAKVAPTQKEPPNGQRRKTDLRGSPVRRNHKVIRVRTSF